MHIINLSLHAAVSVQYLPLGLILFIGLPLHQRPQYRFSSTGIMSASEFPQNRFNASAKPSGSVSPSVYVFLTSLNAQDLCGPVGYTYPLVFTSYPQTDLSTSTLATSFSGLAPSLGVYTQINYADFDSP